MKVIVGISGASLGLFGIKTANALFDAKCDVCVIFSQNAKISLACESLTNSTNFNPSSLKTATKAELLALGDKVIAQNLYSKINIESEIWASPASGSSGFEAMIIAPCSINCLGKIACGLSDSLLTRAASVMIKEQRKLVLGVREMPLSIISLEQMSALAKLGVIMAPPVLASYSGDEMQNFIIGKWLDILGVKNDLYKRWE